MAKLEERPPKVERSFRFPSIRTTNLQSFGKGVATHFREILGSGIAFAQVKINGLPVWLIHKQADAIDVPAAAISFQSPY